ncbi:4-hydroxy-2-oxoglutarate aldolase, mitochondrial 5 [Colletotrichum truncatum]|uniref:4-hydroxy-2-oxoglutarate aldolase, mitochondrial 5 n=1 Tax=Colletotrichum truncatum TaxID=5467 RepID=A0ACC3YHD5_COLTU|nr:4-hydroxy-2-oxoglutarate aldolase, mitochondrial 5 [Colletotrichum truncatum]KAF6792827.1 4-hydroxy-2-oxoglutarate aldolase, mitochondrial 5 [Colletotrichum truncatum]
MVSTKSFPPGIHVPSLTWFGNDSNQEIDWDVQTKHLDFLVRSGLHGIVLAGTNGEAVTLTNDEKAKLVKTTREVAVAAGRPDIAITMGCGGQSTRDVIAETKLAKEAGADYALVLVPSYFHFAMNEEAIVGFFEELANASPIPVIIYNFPGVVAGLDVNSDMLSRLGKHPNIIGVKLTCGGIAKVARVRAEFEPSEFFALAGQSDWLVPAMSVGSTGTITGVANLYPKYCIEIFDLYNSGKLQEASAAQLKLAQMEWAFGKGGINGTKWVVAKSHGYPLTSCHCRRPYPQYTDEKKQAWISGLVAPLAEEEAKLNSRA